MADNTHAQEFSITASSDTVGRWSVTGNTEPACAALVFVKGLGQFGITDFSNLSRQGADWVVAMAILVLRNQDISAKRPPLFL